jgi:hypothetical protein
MLVDDLDKSGHGRQWHGNTRTKMAAKQGPARNMVSGDVTRNPVA